MFVNRDLFTNSVIQQMARVTVTPKKPVEPKPAVVNVNPLSSTEALKTKEELALTTKQKEAKARETEVVESLFDLKGNTKHKEQAAMQASETFKNPFGTPSSFKNPFASATNPFGGGSGVNLFNQPVTFGNLTQTSNWVPKTPAEKESDDDDNEPLKATDEH
jgi:hypothetical protein